MNRTLLIVAIFLTLILSLVVKQNYLPVPAATYTPTLTPTPLETITPTVEPTITPTSTPTPTPAYVFPMTRYTERITNRGHGKQITAADREAFPCGDTFSGYHAGDDLEIFSEELSQDVPVFAVGPGTVKQVSAVGGYGGLIIIEHTLADQTYTGYYGHIDLSNTSVKVGDRVQIGQQITILGDHCSTESSNERKHLHFALRRGTGIDVRGYVPNQSDLTAWVDPVALLKSLNAGLPQ